MLDLNAIADRYERRMLTAFNDIVSSIKNQAIQQEIAFALNNNDFDAVIELLGLDEATWSPLADEIQQSYREGGITGALQIGRIPIDAGSIALRFNVRNLRAENWIREQSSRLITEIVEDQKKLIREALEDGLANGRGPTSTALDIVGRIDPQTKQRVGGYIGLTSQQAGWIRNARTELENLDASYFDRKLRDKRFDSTIRKAIASGKPISQKTIDSAINRMQQRALKFRGDVIARTESIAALKAGQYESIIQAIEKGRLDIRDVIKFWDATGDDRTREAHLHAELQYKDGIPLDQPFIVDLEPMMYPSDPNGSAKNTIMCRCRLVTKIDFGKRVARIEGFQ